MKLVIFGATGGTGRQLVEQALAEGHQVTAFARRPAALQVRHDRLRIAAGDVSDAARVESAIEGQDAVLSALGATKKQAICADGMANILAAMRRAGVRRVIVLSAFGASDSHDRSLYTRLLWLFIRERMADKDRMEQLIKRSDLEWTLVRPPRLTDGPRTQRYRSGLDLRMTLNSRISRADTAAFMLRQLVDPNYLGKAPAIAG
jgi:putative NADH-flavin reductase